PMNGRTSSMPQKDISNRGLIRTMSAMDGLTPGGAPPDDSGERTPRRGRPAHTTAARPSGEQSGRRAWAEIYQSHASLGPRFPPDRPAEGNGRWGARTRPDDAS